MDKDRVIALLDSVKRRVNCMSEDNVWEKFEGKDLIEFRSYWHPTIYTMTIQIRDIPDEKESTS